MPKKKANSRSGKSSRSAPKKPSVLVYSTLTCPWCQKTKEFLKANNVPFRDINVGADEKAREDMFRKSGQFGVPVTDINGRIIVGYDVAALKKELKIYG